MKQAFGIRVEGHYEIGGQPLFGPIAFTVLASKWTCILGSSGVGKSTLLRLIAQLPMAGEFTGTITAEDKESLEVNVSYMAQSDLLLPWLTVVDNVMLGNRLRGQVPKRDRALHLIKQVGLEDHSSKKPAALSGGMRQRAALARTLMEDRPIVLLDEPFSALDAKTRAEMQELSAEVFSGRTVLLVTHDPAEAARLGDQILVMTENDLLEFGVPTSLPVRSADDPATLDCQSRLMAVLRGQTA